MIRRSLFLLFALPGLVALPACPRRAPRAPSPASPELPGDAAPLLPELPPPEVERLVEALGTPAGGNAAERLARSTPAAFPVMKRILLAAPRPTTERLLRVLARHVHVEARDVIRAFALESEETWRRRLALETLLSVADETPLAFLRPLGPLLGPRNDPAVRLAVLALLEKRPVPFLRRRLLLLLSDPAEEIRRASLRALRVLVEQDEATAARLAGRIEDVKPPAARLALARALSRVEGKASRTTLEELLGAGDPAVRRETVRALREQTPARPAPPALYALLLDDDPGVFEETLAFFHERGGMADLIGIASLLARPRARGERRQRLGDLLDRLAGTDVGPDEQAFREAALAWMSETARASRPSGKPSVVRSEPPAPRPAPPPFPWKTVAPAGALALLALAGLVALEARRRASSGHAPTAQAERRPGGAPPTRSVSGRVGKWLFDHRILVLFPWFLPPLLLFEAGRLPDLPWRLCIYGLVALGAVFRVGCTGFRTWAYRSSGERHLMTAGPYAFARHPIYVANLLLALPVFLAVNLLPLTAAFAVWFAGVHFVIVVREDEVLHWRYGKAWETYAAKVRRFLPRFRPVADRRGSFSWEPILKGMEVPKAVAILVLYPLVFEVLPGAWDGAAAWMRGWLGL